MRRAAEPDGEIVFRRYLIALHESAVELAQDRFVAGKLSAAQLEDAIEPSLRRLDKLETSPPVQLLRG